MSPRLFVHVLSLSSRKLMSYRVDFWINSVAAFVVEIAVAYSLWTAIFRTSGKATIGGFTPQGMVLYYVLALLIGKLVRGEERESTLSRDIYEGTLTRYLVFPVPYFLFKYAEHLAGLAPAVAQLAVFGTAAFFFLDLSALGTITAGSVVATLVAVVVGNLLAFLLGYVIESIAFWADNVWSINVLVRFLVQLLGGQMLPLNIFPDWARQILDLLPFRFFYYFPVMTLTGRVDAAAYVEGLGVALFWCALLGLAGRATWRRGYLVYTGVGI